jgi:hypothetical protein
MNRYQSPNHFRRSVSAGVVDDDHLDRNIMATEHSQKVRERLDYSAFFIARRNDNRQLHGFTLPRYCQHRTES